MLRMTRLYSKKVGSVYRRPHETKRPTIKFERIMVAKVRLWNPKKEKQTKVAARRQKIVNGRGFSASNRWTFVKYVKEYTRENKKRY